jgi:trimethylamine--corrinoid protein Co-methyltransferase
VTVSETLKKIHRASLRILEEIGIRLHHPDILELLEDRGIRVDGNTAYFTEKQIRQWINKAPGRFSVTSRSGEHDMLIGGENIEYAAGYGTPTIVDPDGVRRPATLEDFLNFVKMVHQIPYFNLNGGILVQPCDVIPDQSSWVMMYATLTHSDKCIMGLPGSAREVEQLMQMVARTVGGTEALMRHKYVITMISTLSPLQIDHAALDTMMVCARYGQPLIISPAPATGTTGPVVMAGNISLANAEALAAIAVSQMLREGMPVIYGLQSNAADMRSGQISIGSPGYSIQAKYCAQLARMYGLPSRTGGTNTDAKGVSVQSGYEAMMSMLTACQNQVNLIIHSAGILDSYAATSYEQFIVDIEIISMIEYFLADIKTDPEDFAFEVIKEVGIGGQFLTTEHTADLCLTEPWHPRIGLRGGPLGESTPNAQFMANIQREIDSLLTHYRIPDVDPQVQTDLRRFLIDTAGVDPGVLDRIDAIDAAAESKRDATP